MDSHLQCQSQCLPKFQDLQGKDYSTVLENVPEIISRLQELVFIIFDSIFQKYAGKKWTVTCNVKVNVVFHYEFKNLLVYLTPRSTCPPPDFI